MNGGIKRVWRQADTWRGLGYTYFRNSKEWREVIESNPSFDIRFHPAAETTINITTEGKGGKITPSRSTPGLLKQTDNAIEIPRPTTRTNPAQQPAGIFPWSSFEGYSNRLGDYTALALMTPDQTNGYSLDSPQATRDTRRG